LIFIANFNTDEQRLECIAIDRQ